MDLTKFIKTKDDTHLDASKTTNVLFATSEVAPFSKTGGLGDVAASLPKALAERGHRVSVITPLYGHLDPDRMHLARRLKTLSVPRKAKSQNQIEATIWEGRFDGGVRIFFVDCPEYFGRTGVYGYEGDTFEDNAERFAFFSRAVVEFLLQFDIPVDVLHCNDWHTALAPLYMEHYYKKELGKVGTVLTLHNAAYQGTFDKKEFDSTGLPKSTFLKEDKLAQNGSVNYLKGGIVYSDWVTAVSPTYSEELKTEKGGFGLHELFQERDDRLRGILNGADYSVWSPERDHHVAVRYSQEHLNGKRRNKAELQHEFGLPVRPLLPLVGFVGRLTEQKGLDMFVPAVRKLLKEAETERDGFQVVILGEGDAKYRKAISKLVDEFPTRVAARFEYDDTGAHRIFAGVDILAMPSEYEPCGLTQIYAMKYGALPVVHSTGGLADTVRDADSTKGTGFVFDKYTKAGFTQSLSRAVGKYRHHRQWRPLMINAMSADFSWSQSARQYEDLYLDLRGWKPAKKEEKPAKADKPAKKSTGKKKTSAKAEKEKSTEKEAKAEKSTAAKKTAAKKSTTSKPKGKKTEEKSADAEETAPKKKAPAKKAAAKKTTAKKTTKKAPSTKAAAKKAPAKKTTKKSPSKTEDKK